MRPATTAKLLGVAKLSLVRCILVAAGDAFDVAGLLLLGMLGFALLSFCEAGGSHALVAAVLAFFFFGVPVLVVAFTVVFLVSLAIQVCFRRGS